jgi:hypothetical protein
MSPRRVLLGALALLAAGLLWWLSRNPAGLPPHATAPAATSTQRHPATPAPARAAPAEAASSTSAEPSPLALELNSTKGSIEADLRIVLEIVDAFRTNFPREGNPVGSNAEITAALTGANKLGLALIPPGHRAINAAGELCDRWGTPFFFHAESGRRMEIRSAGPDRRMWTGDDVVRTP